MSNEEVQGQKKEGVPNLYLDTYKIVVDMLKKEDNLSWQQNGILIAINGGLLTAIGSIQPNTPGVTIQSISLISMIICILGVIVCCFWYLIANRIESFYDHWYEQLKYLEKNELKSIQIFTIADEFFENKQIQLGDKIFKLRRMASIIKMFTAIQILITVLIVVWILLGVYFCIKI